MILKRKEIFLHSFFFGVLKSNWEKKNSLFLVFHDRESMFNLSEVIFNWICEVGWVRNLMCVYINFSTFSIFKKKFTIKHADCNVLKLVKQVRYSVCNGAIEILFCGIFYFMEEFSDQLIRTCVQLCSNETGLCIKQIPCLSPPPNHVNEYINYSSCSTS